MAERLTPESVGLPHRPFLYTLDQVGMFLSVDLPNLKKFHIHFDGVPGKPMGKMLARNINPPDEKPDWRISERDLIRYLRLRGFHVYDPGWVE